MTPEEAAIMKVEMRNLKDLTEKVLNQQSETNNVQTQLAESNVRLSIGIEHLVEEVRSNKSEQLDMKREQVSQGNRLTKIEERIDWIPGAKGRLIGVIITALAGTVAAVAVIKGG